MTDPRPLSDALKHLAEVADNIERGLPGGPANTYTAAFGIKATTADDIRAVLDALSHQGEGWREIESAPKDGTPIIAWTVHANAKYSGDPVGEGWAAPVITHWIDHNCGGWTWHGLAGVHTHWMPLPAAPVPSLSPNKAEPS